jgi:outer membrane lipoprotein SlyB
MIMTRTIPFSFTLCLLFSPLCMADQVVREVPDTTAGKGAGVVTGLMVGAVGGPIGALIGAGAGFFAGSSVQEAAGLTETAYEVKDAQGEVSTVRSPNARFEPGQQVTRKGSRLQSQES